MWTRLCVFNMRPFSFQTLYPGHGEDSSGEDFHAGLILSIPDYQDSDEVSARVMMVSKALALLHRRPTRSR